jgi:hypothetical protein
MELRYPTASTRRHCSSDFFLYWFMSQYVECSDDLMNIEFEEMWKEAAVVYIEVLWY